MAEVMTRAEFVAELAAAQAIAGLLRAVWYPRFWTCEHCGRSCQWSTVLGTKGGGVVHAGTTGSCGWASNPAIEIASLGDIYV